MRCKLFYWVLRRQCIFTIPTIDVEVRNDVGDYFYVPTDVHTRYQVSFVVCAIFHAPQLVAETKGFPIIIPNINGHFHSLEDGSVYQGYVFFVTLV